MEALVTPAPLQPGDRIAIVTPATKIKAEYVAGAVSYLTAMGYDPVVYPHADGEPDGSFAATRKGRLSDLCRAIADPEVKAILCARGGYGCQQLIGDIDPDMIRANHKWLIGFSDITALHALWLTAGVRSLHASMAKHMTLQADYCSDTLMRNLRGDFPPVTAAAHTLNLCGNARGTLIGGNLAVLNGLAATPFDLLSAARARGAILFIEDIGENIYEIDRILTRLAMAGTLNVINGLIVGQFTEYHQDLNYPDMETMISRRLEILRQRYCFSFPVAFGFPVGHVDDNRPMPEGAEVTLSVSERGTTLEFLTDEAVGETPTAAESESPTIREIQRTIDNWIRDTGGGYFSELTNMALLTEETGELARIIARKYGQQRAKEGDMRHSLAEELADVLWVTVCLANQTGTDLTTAIADNIRKKAVRDARRFKQD